MIYDVYPELAKLESINSDKYVVTGGESRDWVFSPAVAHHMLLADAALYKDGRIDGIVDGKIAIPVADLNNEGSSISKWNSMLTKAGAKVKHAFFYVDRMEDGVDVMRDLGLGSHAVVPLDGPAWGYLKQQDVVTAENYRNLQGRETKEERRAWAERMLRTKEGLRTLADLLNHESPVEVAKGKKVLDIGYPDMKEELVDRLRIKYGDGILLKVK